MLKNFSSVLKIVSLVILKSLNIILFIFFNVSVLKTEGTFSLANLYIDLDKVFIYPWSVLRKATKVWVFLPKVLFYLLRTTMPAICKHSANYVYVYSLGWKRSTGSSRSSWWWWNEGIVILLFIFLRNV